MLRLGVRTGEEKMFMGSAACFRCTPHCGGGSQVKL